MRALTVIGILFGVASCTLPRPLAGDSTKLEHPVFVSPQIVAPEAFGAPPEVIHLDSSKLMARLINAPIQPIPGFEGNGVPVSALQDRTLKDGRYHQTKKGYPWDYIGTVVSSNGTHCTGSLVGPRHVATARHCVNSLRDAQASFVFSPHYDRGTNGYSTSSAKMIVHLPGSSSLDDCSSSDDWAILILDDKLGEKYGWFGLIPFSQYKANLPMFSNLGYPSDLAQTEVPYQQDGISAFSTKNCKSFENGAPITTDMHLAKGHSGGPLWYRNDIGQNWLYGVASGSSDAESVFAGGKEFILRIMQLRTDYP